MPWLRAEPFFFGVGGIADQNLLGITLPNVRGDDAAGGAATRFNVAGDSQPSFAFEDATYLRSRLHDRRR